jgi:AraC-like DNA-binding protein
VPAATLKIKKQFSPLERFIGEEVSVLNKEQIAISNYIRAEWISICLPIDTVPEDTGRLCLFPIDDHKFSLHLFFIQYPDPADNMAIVCSVVFLPSFFDQYPPETLMANQPFRFDQVTEQQFSICSKTRALLSQLGKKDVATAFIKSLKQSETAINLLRLTLECITFPFNTCQQPACRFLLYESEREKILEACNIIEQNIDQAFSIKELSRKVAMNECYLKKGFKAITGKTIHDYQQELRIAKARELLHIEGHSVTYVANMLGYSSISHFSTAFKRVTGMKPCELLA